MRGLLAPKSLHITHLLGGLGFGGAEFGVLRLIRGLKGRPFRHAVLTASPEKSLLEAIGLHVDHHSMRLRGRSYGAFLRMGRLFRRLGTHIVHVNNLALWPDAVLGARLAGCPCIETFHGIEASQLRFGVIKKTLFKIAAQASARITAVAHEAASLFSSITGIDGARVLIIPNGVDTSFFRPPGSWEEKRALRKSKGLPDDRVLVGCVAALRPVKNHEGLLEAFSRAIQDQAAPTTLVFVGDGPLAAPLARRAASLGVLDRTIFLGRRMDTAELLRCFDLFVLNSDTEGLSYALLEAMASGLPVVCTSVGAASGLITDGREGFLVPPRDVAGLERVFKDVLQNPAVFPTMGEQARMRVLKDYAFETMLERYAQLYEEVFAFQGSRRRDSIS